MRTSNFLNYEWRDFEIKISMSNGKSIHTHDSIQEKLDSKNWKTSSFWRRRVVNKSAGGLGGVCCVWTWEITSCTQNAQNVVMTEKSWKLWNFHVRFSRCRRRILSILSLAIDQWKKLKQATDYRSTPRSHINHIVVFDFRSSKPFILSEFHWLEAFVFVTHLRTQMIYLAVIVERP